MLVKALTANIIMPTRWQDHMSAVKI